MKWPFNMIRMKTIIYGKQKLKLEELSSLVAGDSWDMMLLERNTAIANEGYTDAKRHRHIRTRIYTATPPTHTQRQTYTHTHTHAQIHTRTYIHTQRHTCTRIHERPVDSISYRDTFVSKQHSSLRRNISSHRKQIPISP